MRVVKSVTFSEVGQMHRYVARAIRNDYQCCIECRPSEWVVNLLKVENDE